LSGTRSGGSIPARHDPGSPLSKDGSFMNRSAPAALAQGFSNFGHSFSHILTLLYPTVVLALEKDWGLSYGELIGLMLAGQILFGAAALPAGWLGDRWSSLGMMVVFFLGSGIATVMTGFARSPLEIGLGMALIGTFAAIYHPVGLAWLIRSAVNRGRALGVNGVYGAMGVALGPLIAGALTDFVSWRAAFIVPGTVATLLGVALAIAWACGWVSETKADLKPQPEPTRESAYRAFYVLSVTMLCVGLISQAFMVVLPKLFAERAGDIVGGAFGVGALVTGVYMASMVAQYVGGRLSDRLQMKQIYVGAFVLLAPLLLATAVFQSWPLILVAVAIVFIQVGALPSENGLLAYYTPSRWRGTAYGAKFVLALGVSALAIPLAGYIHDRTGGFFWLFVVLAGCAVIVVAVGMLLPNERAKTRPAPRVAVPAATPAE